MKMTKTDLKKIIQEELEAQTLNEMWDWKDIKNLFGSKKELKKMRKDTEGLMRKLQQDIEVGNLLMDDADEQSILSYLAKAQEYLDSAGTGFLEKPEAFRVLTLARHHASYALKIAANNNETYRDLLQKDKKEAERAAATAREEKRKAPGEEAKIQRIAAQAKGTSWDTPQFVNVRARAHRTTTRESISRKKIERIVKEELQKLLKDK